MRAPFSKIVEIDGKKYAFELTVDAHRRIKKLAEISLPDCIADVRGKRTKEEHQEALKGYHALMSDWDRLPVVMYAMIEPQLKEASITQEQFERKLTGPVMLAAANAITEALIDFFPDDPRGKILASAVEAVQRLETVSQKMQTKATEQMNEAIAEMEKKIDEQGSDAAKSMIQEQWTTSLKTLPESLAAILAPSRSGN